MGSAALSNEGSSPFSKSNNHLSQDKQSQYQTLASHCSPLCTEAANSMEPTKPEHHLLDLLIKHQILWSWGSLVERARGSMSKNISFSLAMVATVLRTHFGPQATHLHGGGGS